MDSMDRRSFVRRKHFLRIIRYRSFFGLFIAGIGFVLLLVGLKKLDQPLILINGVMFAGYGLFMNWQAKRARKQFMKAVNED